MRSKTKTTAKNEETRPALVPKLRFPEFRKEEGWKNTTLGDVTFKTEKRNKGGKSYPVYSISNKTGFTPQSEQFEGVDSEKRGYDIALYKLIESKTFAYNPARINVGSLGFSGELNNVIISSLYVCFKTMSGAADEFLLHFFGTSDFEKSVNNHVEGGIRSYLFYENFARIGIPLPSLSEQQKIAECLSSVDELMAAQARKVDALKTHKKGLMQQLFPGEGETQPRLRFPEFQNAGEWELRSVSQFAKVTTGAKDTQNKVEGGKYPFFVRSQTVERIDSYSYDGEAVLTSGDGVGVGKNFHHINGKFDFHQRVYCIYEFAEGVSGLFFYLYFSDHFGERVMRMSAKNSVDSVRMAMITEMPVLLPPLPEQQRIASCLSSLDALITAETQKHEALKTHKKGLMQQLFPSPEEMI